VCARSLARSALRIAQPKKPRRMKPLTVIPLRRRFAMNLNDSTKQAVSLPASTAEHSEKKRFVPQPSKSDPAKANKAWDDFVNWTKTLPVQR
jgi:hypothetical protein